jgi:hypothetical protein
MTHGTRTPQLGTERQMKLAEQIMQEDSEILDALASRAGNAAALSPEKAADPSASPSMRSGSGRDDDH